MNIVVRVQGADGRGPWRPGFSLTWLDGDAPAGRLTESLLDLMPIAEILALPADMTYGSACRNMDALMAWFTPCERERLAVLGFHPVRLNVDIVLAESATQLVVGRRRPFTDGATRLRWQ